MGNGSTICAVLAVATAALGLAGCDSSSKSAAETDPNQIAEARIAKSRIAETFEDSFFDEPVPTADGGAYVVSVAGKVWYMKEGKAVRVKESSESTALKSGPLDSWLWAMLARERRLGKEKAVQAVEDYQADLESDAEADYEYGY